MQYVEGKLNGIPTVSELMDEVKKCEDGLDSKLGRNDLIAGENINIEKVKDKVIISAIGGSSEYIAGDGINIRNNIISFDNHKLDNYATKEEIPDISGLATKEELSAVEAQIPDVSQFITDEEVAEEYLSKTDASNTYATKNDIPDVSDFVTNENLEITLQDYAKESEIPTDYVVKSTKIGNVEIQEGIENLDNLRYGKVEKPVESLVDGQEYVLPTTYNLDDFEVEDILTFLYTQEDPYLEIGIKEKSDFKSEIDELKAIYFATNDEYFEYNNELEEWAKWDNELEDLIPCDAPSFVLDITCVVPDTEDLLKKVLGLENQKELVEVTLKEKVEDLPNWQYNKEIETKYIYGIEDDKQYKINFNVMDYINDLSTFGSGNTLYEAYNIFIRGYDTSPATMRINFNDTTYWFILDVTDTTNYGAWRKGGNYGSNIYYDAYTPEELSNVTFTLDITKIPSDATLLNYFKNIIVNEDGSAVDELIDGNTYKVNFDNNQAFIDLLEYYFDNITSGGLEIYNPNVDTNSIRIWNATGGTYGLSFKVNSNYYYFMQELGENYPGRWYSQSYRASNYIYPREALDNIYFTMNRAGMYDEALLRKLITNVDGTPIPEDHEETKITTETLKEHLDDYKNWYYETNGVGIFNIPKWEVFESLGVSFEEVYNNEDHLQIGFYESPFATMLEIYDIDNDKGYTICNQDYDTPKAYFKANTWYNYNLRTQDDLKECATPEIILDSDYIINQELCDSIYGERTFTLSQKINSIDKKLDNIEPLEDKIYTYIEQELENGKTYYLDNNYDSFFDKYGNDSTLVFYGDEISDSLDPKDVEELDNTKAAKSLQVTGIKLWTDSKPFIIRNGEKANGISLLGGAIIYLYTNDPGIILTFNQGDDSWTSGKSPVPTEVLPVLVLDSSLVHNEQMLKDFLKLGNKTQLLVEKFDEVDEKLNTPLDDKVYSYTKDNILYNGKKYAFRDNLDEFFSKGYDYVDIYDIFGGQLEPTQSLGKAPAIEVDAPEEKEEYVIHIRYSWSFNDDHIETYIELYTNKYLYWFNDVTKVWNVDGVPMTPPDLTYYNEYVLNENMLKDILVLTKSQTLKEKIEDLPNWKYKDSSVLRPVEVPDWQAISQLPDWDDDQIIIYMDEQMVHMPAIAIERNAGEYGIRIIDNLDMQTLNGIYYVIYSTDVQDKILANKWYRALITHGQEGEPVEVSVDDIPDYVFDNTYMLRQDAFDLIYQGNFGTLAQKLDSIEAPYSIVNYEETSGTLNSITVKSKETGEEITLNVDGGKQSYQHNIQLRSPIGYLGCVMTVTTDNNTPFTKDSLKAWVSAKGFNSATNLYGVSGVFASTSLTYVASGIYTSGAVLKFFGYSLSDGAEGSVNVDDVNDIVIAP